MHALAAVHVLQPRSEARHDLQPHRPAAEEAVRALQQRLEAARVGAALHLVASNDGLREMTGVLQG